MRYVRLLLYYEHGRRIIKMTHEEINKVNEGLWDKIDNLKEKSGYNDYLKARKSTACLTLTGWIQHLYHNHKLLQEAKEKLKTASDFMHYYANEIETADNLSCNVELDEIDDFLLKF